MNRFERDQRHSRIVLWVIGIGTFALLLPLTGVRLADIANAAYVTAVVGILVLAGAVVLGVLTNGTVVLFERLHALLHRRRR